VRRRHARRPRGGDHRGRRDVLPSAAISGQRDATACPGFGLAVDRMDAYIAAREAAVADQDPRRVGGVLAAVG